MDPNAPLTIVAIDASNWRQALGVRVADHQLRFVADHQPVALVSLAKCFVRPGGLAWTPLAICAQREMIGLVTLAHAVERPTECELLHFVIDIACQGHGLGRRAVGAIVDHVRRRLPTVTSITLTVDTDNAAGLRLYRSQGFVATGFERMGEPVYRLDLSPLP